MPVGTRGKAVPTPERQSRYLPRSSAAADLAETTWWAYGWPAKAGNGRSWFVDQTRVIRTAPDGAYGAGRVPPTSPPRRRDGTPGTADDIALVTPDGVTWTSLGD